MGPLVTCDWLRANLSASDVRVVDASWYLPQTERDAEAEYLAAHIPGAVRFDIDEVRNHASDLPHMLASADEFAAAAGRLGIARTDGVVVYDGIGLFSAPRVWFNFRMMGCEQVAVLDGGLPAWEAAGYQTESGAARPEPAIFDPAPDTTRIYNTAAVLANGSRMPILDARPADRFEGRAAEPREGIRPGHIPGSANLPFTELQEGGRMLDAEGLRAAFDRAGADPAQPFIATCGSGVTAATLILAQEALGHKVSSVVYDGSWSEWGGRHDLPAARGTKA